MRATTGHGNTEALGTPHRNIGPKLTDGLEQNLGERIDGHRGQSPMGMGLLNHWAGIPQAAATPWELKQHPKHIGIPTEGLRLGSLQHNAQGFGAGLQHRPGLRQHRRIHQKTLGVWPFANRQAQPHRLCSRSGLIQQRSVGNREPRQLADQGLKVEQRFEAALGDFGLVRGVSGVPGRVLEHMAFDQRRGRGVVITQANQRATDTIAGSHQTQFRQRFGLTAAMGHGLNRRPLIKNCPGHHSPHEGIEIGEPKQLEHALLIGLVRADVALHKRRELDCCLSGLGALFELGQVALAVAVDSR